MPGWFEAGFWGLVSGSALVFGALAGFYLPVPRRVIAGFMAFGAGVLIAALAFDLIDEAHHYGGVDATVIGVIMGAGIFTSANWLLARAGARHRKRSGPLQPKEAEDEGSGTALAIGALIDGIPEAIAIGLSLLVGGAVSVVTITAVFLANFPEGLSSASGMRHAGRPTGYVFGVWGGIALISGLGAVLGYSVIGGLSDQVIGITIAIAGGAILAMLADTMIPEAFHDAHLATGLFTTAGFLVAFTLGYS